MKADYEQQLDTAKEQAADIIAAARVRSEKEHSKAIADTEAERVKMLAQAREDIEKEQANARKNCSHRSWISPCWLQRKLL